MNLVHRRSLVRYTQLTLCLIAATQLTGCGFFTKKPDTNALCIAECPAEFAPLRDDTFGATTTKLKEVLDTYFLCRQACQVKK